jgi:hypothetical protein
MILFQKPPHDTTQRTDTNNYVVIFDNKTLPYRRSRY